MDILDDADRATEAFHREAISNRATEGPPADGFCHNCGSFLSSREYPDPDARWCDADCRDDWQARVAREPIRALASA